MPEAPEKLDDFAIIERIVPRTKPRGLLGISFGSIKIDENEALPPPPPGPEKDGPARARAEAAPPLPPAPDTEAGLPEEEEAEPARKSLLSMFRRGAAEDPATATPESADAPAPGDQQNVDKAERKRAQQALKAERQAEKKAEKERRKAEKEAAKEARRAEAAAALEQAGRDAAGNGDLPGPPPDSLRRPYPELRKPIAAAAKRRRPDPFPELRKPPEQRRPRPEPFPELRKPNRPKPEPFPELRKPEGHERAEDQSAQGDPKEADAAGAVADEDASRTETEKGKSRGWLSGLLKPARKPADEETGADADSGEAKASSADEPKAEPPATEEGKSGGWLSGMLKPAEDVTDAAYAETEAPATATPDAGDPVAEEKATGGWLSGVLKSAEESADKTGAPPSWLTEEPAPSGEDAEEATDSAQKAEAGQQDVAPEGVMAEASETPPAENTQAETPDTAPAAGEAGAVPPGAPEAASPLSTPADTAEEPISGAPTNGWHLDEEYRRRTAEALAQAAMLESGTEYQDTDSDPAPQTEEMDASAPGTDAEEERARDGQADAARKTVPDEMPGEGREAGAGAIEETHTESFDPVQADIAPEPVESAEPATGEPASDTSRDVTEPHDKTVVRTVGRSAEYERELAARARRRSGRTAARKPASADRQLELKLPDEDAASVDEAANAADDVPPYAEDMTAFEPHRPETGPEPLASPETPPDLAATPGDAGQAPVEPAAFGPAAFGPPAFRPPAFRPPAFRDEAAEDETAARETPTRDASASETAGYDTPEDGPEDGNEDPFAGSMPPRAPDRPYAGAPEPEAYAGHFREPAEPYTDEREAQDAPQDSGEPEADQPGADETPDTDENNVAEPVPEERPANPYADLLDPSYKPKRGFMDLGRRSILFPDDEEESGSDLADDLSTYGEAPYGAEEDRGGAPGGQPHHEPDGGETEAPRPPQGRGFVPPAWDEPAPASPSRRQDPHHAAPADNLEEDFTPADGARADDRYDEDTEHTEGGGTPGWHGGTNGHGDHAHFEPEAAGNGSAPAVHAGASPYYDDDDEFDDEAPAFVAPEPTGRPDQAAEVMRTIAHADTEYYLPPPKTPGMILLGVGGALLGALLANLLYGALGDVVIPRFMIILIGIQIFGGLGVFVGNQVAIPLGAPRKRSRGAMIQTAHDEFDWPGEAWPEPADHLDRGPVLSGPRPGGGDDPDAMPDTPLNARDAMRPPPPPQ